MPALTLKSLLAMAGPMAVNALSGSGHSTRYWDCCKTSCAWSGKADVTGPVLTCDANDNPISDADATSGCDGGGAFTCSNNSPWAVDDDLAFGFAATALVDGSEDSWCCGCYALTFTSGPVKGKTMVVQSTNTGGDLSDNHFDIQMPGGGLGIFDGCTPQFGSSIPGERYGGVTSRSQCDGMPELLKDGCNWRFDWFKNADNPDFTFEQVQCPKEIVDVTGCKRNDDALFPVFNGASKPAPGGGEEEKEEFVKPTTSEVAAVEVTKAPEADEPVTPKPTTPKPVDETDDGAEKPKESEAVQPVDEEEETEDGDSEEVVDEEEDCEEGNEEVVEEEDEEVIEDDDTEIIEDGDDEEVIDEEEGEEDCEESEPVDEDDEEEDDDDECPATPAPGAEAKLYGQCGGINWTGPTKCAQGSKCEHWNPYYFQCIAA